MITPDNNFPFTATSLNANNFSVSPIHTAHKVVKGRAYDMNISITSHAGVHTGNMTALNAREVVVNYSIFLRISLRSHVLRV